MSPDGSRPTGLIFFPAFDWAISPTHPEREERLLYTRDQIFEEGLMDLPQVAEYTPRLAQLKDVARVHFCVPTVQAQVTDAHLVSAGAALTLADALMAGDIRNGFSLSRPPGHHAMRVVHGNRGFCNINNMAILVEYLRSRYGLRRIAIVDTDVHHGDGTQDIFWHDPDVLFISFHQDGRTLYPGTGFIEELGGPNARGRTLNIPLPPETPDPGILYVLEELVLPILREFQPQLVLNSAGQDNHYTDPLANMRMSAQGYARLNQMLKPDLCVLEGGYAIESALPYVNTGIIQAMAGLDYSHVLEPDYDPADFSLPRATAKALESIVAQLLKMWNQRDTLVAEARRRHGDVFREHRQVFYDTDMIQEAQDVSVRLCPRCPGWLAITTHAVQEQRRLPSARCVSLPQFACPACRDEARAHFEQQRERIHKLGAEFDYLYFQDKPADVYHGIDAHSLATQEY